MAQTSGTPELTYAQERSLALSVAQRYSPYDRAFKHFLTLRNVTPQKRELSAAAMRFFVPSVSRAIELDRQIPRRVRGSDLYLIDRRDLQWSYADWVKVMRRYPYSDKRDSYGNVNPLIVRGDWLLHELSDTSQQSDSYYRLLYGGRSIPKTRDQFLKFWRVDRKLQRGLEISFIEGKSGVAVNQKRLIDFLDRPLGYAWGTRDALKIDRKTDPLEHPLRDQKHDGEEWIVGFPKRSAKHGRYSSAQAYFLANGQGNRVEEAPTGLVIDHTSFKGQPSIRTAGSCIQCHERGINPTTQNELRYVIQNGVQLYALKNYKAEERYKEIERTLLMHIDVEITRNQEDYTSFLATCNPGLAPEQNAAAFQGAINWYVSDVTLEQAARELYSSPEELKFAIGYAADKGYLLGGRLSSLAYGLSVRRTSWESEYLRAQRVLIYWRTRN